MRVSRRTIADFVKLDATATLADRFISVKEQQQLRANHNANLAGASRRVVFNSFFRNHLTAGDPDYLPIKMPYQSGAADTRTAARVLSTHVLLSPYTTSLTVHVRGTGTHTGTNWLLYPALARPFQEIKMDAITPLTMTGLNNYFKTFSVPQTSRANAGFQEYKFDLYAVQGTVAAFIHSTVAVTAIASDPIGNVYGVSAATAGLAGTEAIGDLIYFTVPTNIEARVIHEIVIGGGTTTFFVNRRNPWSFHEPSPAVADTLRTRDSGWPSFEQITLVEKSTTSEFDMATRPVL